MSARTFAVFIAALALVGLLGFGLVAKGTDTVPIGEPIPDAELPRLGATGTGSIAAYQGDWVLVNVWASWCDPCRTESPVLQRFYERYRDRGFTVLGIDTQDATSDALEFIDEFGLTYPQLHDGDGDRQDELGMTGLPESFLVDPDGDLVARLAGPVEPEHLQTCVAPSIRAGEPRLGRCTHPYATW